MRLYLFARRAVSIIDILPFRQCTLKRRTVYDDRIARVCNILLYLYRSYFYIIIITPSRGTCRDLSTAGGTFCRSFSPFVGLFLRGNVFATQLSDRNFRHLYESHRSRLTRDCTVIRGWKYLCDCFLFSCSAPKISIKID